MAEQVGLQIKPQNGLTSISDIVGIAQGLTNLQKSRATLAADIAQRKAESRKAEIETGVAEETSAPRVEEQKQKTQQSQIETIRQKLGLSSAQMDKIEGNSNAMMADPAVKAAADPNTPEEQLPALKQRLHSIVDQHLGFVKALGIPGIGVGA